MLAADQQAWWQAASRKQSKQQQVLPQRNEFVDEEVWTVLGHASRPAVTVLGFETHMCMACHEKEAQ